MQVYFRIHAVQRMFERRVSVNQVLRALHTGETVEDYSSEMPEPGRLTLGFLGKYPFHVVSSENPETSVLTVITVYRPNSDQWSRDFRRRRS